MPEMHWNKKNITELFDLPVFELVHQAYVTHKAQFPEGNMELCTLLSIKTGRCPEDCGYCPQSGHYNTELKNEKLFDLEKVIEEAKVAQKKGAQRFCMGAAWRSPPQKDFPKVLEMIKAVKSLGLETCVTLGMLDQQQAEALKSAGLDYYNHNLDTSPEFYKSIISTRTYEDRLKTLQHVMAADIHVCCGGILGMGESREDRVQFLLALCKLPKPPKSIPINKLIAIKGTPLEEACPIESFEFIKTIAVTRILFPEVRIRLSAGREEMSEELQAWCFMAGANSIFIGDKLLTAKNPSQSNDFKLLKKLGITPLEPIAP